VLAPTNLPFGNQVVGTTSGALTVTVTDSSSGTVNIWGIAITGANASDFSETTSCGTTLGPGPGCRIGVTFTPSGTGARAATLLVSNDGGASPQAVALSGSGVTAPAAPSGSLSATAVSFGEQEIGTTTVAQTVVLTNTGHSPIMISRIFVKGPNNNDFQQTNTCGSEVGAGRSCVLSIRFAPRARGERKGMISIEDSAQGKQYDVLATGIGRAPAISPRKGVLAPGGSRERD
jgi:hypothetical protein